MKDRRQQGVVSLFIVMFTTILLSVVAVGFLRLMLQEQKQATNQDLSQSAYDSAMSGVEDAKRVLRMCAQGGEAGEQACEAIDSGSDKCDTVSAAGVVTGQADSTETIIKGADGSGQRMQQGYTCVIINPQSPDFLGNIIGGESRLVALKAAGTNDIGRVSIEWMHKNSSGGSASYAGGETDDLQAPTIDPAVLLPQKSDWSPDAPALLRVQAVLPTDANKVTTADLDTSINSTVYLRPAVITQAGADLSVVLPPRSAGSATTVSSSPMAVNCSKDKYDNGGYACKAVFQVSVPHESNVAFLRLTSLYRDTSIRVAMESGSGGAILFDGVQPVVDSTGRAGNIFRRVSSRLNMSQFILPPAAINVTGSICKDFYLTEDIEAISSGCRTYISEDASSAP